MGVLYNDTSSRRTFYISRIIDEEMKKGDLFVITGMSGAELAIRVLDICLLYTSPSPRDS